MSCDYADCDHATCAEQRRNLYAAREAVIEAARKWEWAANGDFAESLENAVRNLKKLEAPPDPLGPVREFVGLFRVPGYIVFSNGNKDFAAIRKAAEKALEEYKP